MKKSLLLIAALVSNAAVFAQWTAPAPSKVQEMATDGETSQYLYNKEAGGFFAGGNDWGTRASVSTTADPIKFVSLDGEAYNFACYPAAKNAWLYVSCNNFDAMWVDAANAVANSTYPGTDAWQIQKQANGSYKISNSTITGPYTLGVAEIYRGLKGNTRCYINDQEDVYEVDGETTPSISGKFYDEWYFVDEEEYEALKPQVEVYLAAVNLQGKIDAVKAEDEAFNLANINKVYQNTSSTIEELNAAGEICDAAIAFHKALVDAQATYPNLDFSAPTAVYNNVNSTAEELTAASGQIKEIVNNYLATQATFESPIDYSSVIGNGSDVAPWTQEFADDKKVGTWHTNTWSTEANGGADGTDMVTPFCEDWVANGSILSDQKIFQVLKNAAPGLYKFEANVRLYNEKGDVDAITGCNMYFGDKSVTLAEQVEMYKSSGKCVLWSKNKFHIIAIVEESGDIEFGFDIKDATFNWMAFKETSLKYYGNENCQANAEKLIKASYNFEKAEGVDANADVIAAYNNAVDAFDAAQSAEEITAAAAAADAAKTALDANIAAYNKLKDNIKAWEKAVSEKQDLAGAEWDDFSDFMQSEDKIDNYPTPNPVVINDGDRSLTTEEIEEYIKKVDELYASAISHSITDGADCTDIMLVNPKFTDPNGAGWTVTDGKTGKCGNYTARGGLHNFPVAESWHATFDVFQEIDGVPDGIYSLSLNGFCRLDDGETEVAAEIYMNEFATTLQDLNSPEQMVKNDVENGIAIDGYNCYLDNTDNGGWTTNPVFLVEQADGSMAPCGHNSPANNTDSQVDIDGTTYLAPNGMEGASVAFSANRYQAKVYGLVEGGKMRLGIRNTSTHQWALWSNFTLTYEGKSKDALLDLLPQYIEKLENYSADNVDNMTTPAKTVAVAPIADAKNAVAAQDVDAMYQSLSDVNAAMVAAKENVAAVNAFHAVEEEINAALEGNPGAEALAAYDKISDKITGYEALSTADLNELTDQMKEVAELLRIPSTEGATDEEPVDFTAVIINPDFSTGNADGWKYQFAEVSNLGFQNNNVYNGEEVSVDQFIEGWRSGNAPIGDGSIEQTISKLPAGVYTLTVDAIANLQSSQADDPEADDYWETASNGIYLFASEADGKKSAIEIKSANGSPKHFSLVFAKENADSDVTIGIQAIQSTCNWIAADNWTLAYNGAIGESSLVINGDATDAVAIDEVAASKTAASAIYNAAGARINKLQKGLNIVRMADGSVKKIMVK
ncbi:MAG: hypothetical protein MJZ41_09340 [Bacteroidaceae bacterium]|nr:hypothetical protein [Bacteroidaceae bacterium]